MRCASGVSRGVSKWKGAVHHLHHRGPHWGAVSEHGRLSQGVSRTELGTTRRACCQNQSVIGVIQGKGWLPHCSWLFIRLLSKLKIGSEAVLNYAAWTHRRLVWAYLIESRFYALFSCKAKKPNSLTSFLYFGTKVSVKCSSQLISWLAVESVSLLIALTKPKMNGTSFFSSTDPIDCLGLQVLSNLVPTAQSSMTIS